MPELQRLYSTDYLSVDTQLEKNYIQITWLRQPSSDIFRREIKTILEFALIHQINRALFDVRERSFIEVGDQNWLLREIIPLFIGRKLRFAYLVNQVALEAMDVYRIQDAILTHPQLKNYVQVEIFLEKDIAVNWVLEKPV